MTPALTQRQRQVLQLIETTIRTSGAPPTRAEIARQMGFRSPNAAEEHLRALARKGVIELLSGTARGIRLLRAARAELPGRSANLPLPGMEQMALPLIGRVAAGSPMLAEEHIEGHYAVPQNLFSARPDYLLRVRGLSMRDAGILDGDLLAIHRSKEARNGQIVVARLQDEVTVKRLHKAKGRISLLPENPDFEPIVVHPGEPFELEGLVVGLVRADVNG